MEMLTDFAGLIQSFGLMLLIVSIACSYYGANQVNQGEIKKGRVFIKAAFVVAALLTVSYGIVFLATHDMITLILGCVWGWFAYRDWKRIKKLGGW